MSTGQHHQTKQRLCHEPPQHVVSSTDHLCSLSSHEVEISVDRGKIILFSDAKRTSKEYARMYRSTVYKVHHLHLQINMHGPYKSCGRKLQASGAQHQDWIVQPVEHTTTR